MNNAAPLLEIKNLIVEFRLGRKKSIQAVSGINLSIERGETLGLVGESGCGKTSVARAIVQLPPPTAGQILFRGEDLTRANPKRLRQLRPKLQMILQDSVSSLNPRRKVGRSIALPLRIAGNKKTNQAEPRRQVQEMMALVGLDPDSQDRLPSQFSGGQCQRIQIARALIARPELLICDEPVSSLDVSVQAQILNLLEDIRTSHQLTMLFISHDLSVVKNVCDRAAVMYLGKLCEIAPTETLYHSPWHPYTQALFNALPKPDPTLPPPRSTLLSGEHPSHTGPPPGCRFHLRCPKAFEPCMNMEPPLIEAEKGRFVACHAVLERCGATLPKGA